VAENVASSQSAGLKFRAKGKHSGQRVGPENVQQQKQQSMFVREPRNQLKEVTPEEITAAPSG